MTNCDGKEDALRPHAQRFCEHVCHGDLNQPQHQDVDDHGCFGVAGAVECLDEYHAQAEKDIPQGDDAECLSRNLNGGFIVCKQA